MAMKEESGSPCGQTHPPHLLLFSIQTSILAHPSFLLRMRERERVLLHTEAYFPFDNLLIFFIIMVQNKCHYQLSA